MARILLISGKGGVGKTTVAAATALAAAKKGYRTIVLSFDLAHSLSDSFDVERGLFHQNQGMPLAVADNLTIQEIDVQNEIERHWGEVYGYVATLLTSTGLSDMVAEEVAIIPGMEDVISLMYINQYLTEDTYDVIVVDCPPTSDSLRFVNITSTLDWYMRKRFKFDRKMVKLARPIANRLSGFELPDDGYFSAMERIFSRLDGVDELLTNPEVTTVRLVTNAEKMVVRETQRAYMYFCMYGMVTDAIVVNRLMTDAEGFFAQWAQTHATYSAEVEEYFKPLPVFKVPLFSNEVVGRAALEKVVEELYGDADPTARYITETPYHFEKTDDEYKLHIKLPFVDKREIDISRHDQNLVIRIGSFKRHVPLPRSVVRFKNAGAKMEGNQLTVNFVKEEAS